MQHTLLEIQLLGAFRLAHANEPVTTLSAERVQTLLAYLLLHRQAPQPRHHLAFLLWPDASEGQARTNLRNLLHSLRNALPAAETFLETTNLTVQWRLDTPYRLDVADFETAFSAAMSGSDEAIAQRYLIAAIDLYTGDLLPSNYDDWLMPLREELRGRFGQALQRLIDLLENRGDYPSAIRYTMRLLHQDLLNEATYVQLMRLHARSGDRAGVRRVYDQCVAALERELEVEPSPTTTAAYQQLLRLEAPVKPLTPVAQIPPPVQPLPAETAAPPAANLPLPVAPVTTPRPRPLPPQPTPLVGRTREVAEITELLADPQLRLVTLVGPGGVGKTRLSLACAAQVAEQFADGVAFAPLAPVHDVATVYPALATALALTFAGTSELAAQVHHFLHNKTLLLVLDNLEHLLTEVDFVVTLLAEAPQVKLLVTSRERLNLQEEAVYTVGGLPLLTEASDESADSAALQLFLQAARRTRSQFQPTTDDLPAIAQICRLVDGIPLGIELAAAWVHLLSCQEIAAEIGRNLDFLATPARNVPERHRTLRAVFDHSWHLLTPGEQRLLRQLSVFQGGFTRDLAVAVTGATLPVLGALVNKSLLRRNEDSRYELHEQVRQYAYRKLHDADEAVTTRDRHLTALLALVRTAESSAKRAAWAPVEPELTNLRAALEWSLTLADEATPAATTRQIDGVRLATTLTRYWRHQGYLREGVNWLTKGLAMLTTALQSAEPTSDHSLRALQARTLFDAGDLAYSIDHSVNATALLRESLALYRTLDDAPTLGRLLNRLAEVVLDQGDAAQAEAWLTESLALARTLNDRWLMARALSILADLVTERGELALGISYAEEGLALARQLTDRGVTLYLLNILGQMMIAKGNAEQAVQYLEEVLTLRERDATASPEGRAWTLRNLGQARQLAGDLTGAAACYRESLLLRQQLDQLVGMAWAMEGLVTVAVLVGDYQRAVGLASAAARIRQEHQSPMRAVESAHYDALLATVRQALGEQTFTARWAAGAALPVAQAAAYALQKAVIGRTPTAQSTTAPDNNSPAQATRRF
jgi:predicted ATPase/DNA-binding SARP family transcriptional activator